MKQKIIAILVAIIALLGGYQGYQTLGSVDNEYGGYYATSTDSTWDTPCAATGPRFKLLKKGPGVLGSVVITNSTVGRIALYDATTTNHGDYATTTAWGIPIFASLAAGTYTFDATFSKGLIAECTATTNVASSTITWK